MSLPVVEHRSGCVVCGGELVYLARGEAMACVYCGATAESETRCAQGHYVCDACHARSAIDLIARACEKTDSRDPIDLARTLMRHPAFKMHGPEHHFLVPAVLVATWCNQKGGPERKAELLAEARRRSAPVLGGFCGIQGACGAGIGTGIFIALVTGSTPLKGPQRGLANRMTAQALALVGATEGARCCKRDCFLSLLAAVKFARAELGVKLSARGPRCEFSELNRECVEERCPFYPARASARA